MAINESVGVDVEAVHHANSFSTNADSLTAVPEAEKRTPRVSTSSDAPQSIWSQIGVTPASFSRRPDDDDQLNHSLKTRHLRTIALGGCIGAGLFVGSGGALASGGPASLLIGFLIIGLMVFNVVHALAELAVMYDICGGFYTYSARFIHPSWAFAMGWNYCLQWAIVLPLEITVASEVIKFWTTDVSVAVWISAFLVGIVLLNIFGVLGYGEFEFSSVGLKLIAIVVFIITGLVLVLGGGPSDGIYTEYWGARFWYDPGAFRNGFKGFCSVFVTAAFAYAGTELVGLAAAETAAPLKSIPLAVKQMTWRIVIFYTLPLLFVGLLVKSTDKRLFGSGDGFANTTASPFVIVALDAGLNGLDSFICAVIVVSVLAIGNAGVYAGSRTLTALSQQGYAPKVFSYVDQMGRPLISTVVMVCCGCLAYINVAAAGQNIFQWLLSLAGLAALFTWASICVSHIRFRNAWKQQGRSENEIPYKAMFGVAGSWFSLVLIILVLAAQLFVAIKPPGGGTSTAKEFFKSSLTWPLVLFLLACGCFWKQQSWLKLSHIDLDSGRRDIDWAQHRAEQARKAGQPFWKRAIHSLF